MKDILKMIKDKKKIIEDLVNSMEGRNDLHELYKIKMKNILMHFSCSVAQLDDDLSQDEFIKYIDKYVEERCIQE